jgi:hypothetical protein
MRRAFDGIDFGEAFKSRNFSRLGVKMTVVGNEMLVDVFL